MECGIAPLAPESPRQSVSTCTRTAESTGRLNPSRKVTDLVKLLTNSEKIQYTDLTLASEKPAV